MAKQVLIVGLGQFGMGLGQALTERGVEVLAVDTDEERVQTASQFAAQALCFDATNEESLARTAPERRDASVCAIGDEAREASIICTALLRQMGAPRVIARTNDLVHERILRLVGAHEVVNPELEFGKRFATRMAYEGVIGELPLGQELVITELRPPESFVGRTLMELSLPKRYDITVVAIRDPETRNVEIPRPSHKISPGDVLIVVSREGAVGALIERS
jgi:trk system potassium uptake protein TrkA